MFKNIGHGLEQLGLASRCNGGAAVELVPIGEQQFEEDAIGEQQLKRTQSGSSSRIERNRGAVEADAIGEQLKRTQSGSSSRRGRNWGAAAAAALHRELSE